MSDPPSEPPPPGPPRPLPNLAWEQVDNTAVNIVEQRARLGAALLNAGSVPLERVEATVGVPAEIGATVEASISARLDGAGGFSANGVVPRQELIRLLLALSQDGVERLFRAVAELRRHSAGGNEVLASVDKMITDLLLAREVLLSELATDQPRPSVIRLAGRAIRDALDWLGDQVRRIAGKLAEGALKAAGGWLFVEGVTHAEQIKHDAEQILTQLVDLESQLTAIVTPIAHFFASMHLPF